MTTIQASLRKVIAKVLRVDEALVTEDASTKTLKAWNSTRHVEIVMALESEYKVRFSAAEMIALQSVRQIAETLAKKNISA